jgi:hypothetical protein
MDAITCAELVSAARLPSSRCEIAHLAAAPDRLAEVLGERQRRERCTAILIGRLHAA